MVLTPVAEEAAREDALSDEGSTLDAELEQALAAARSRGRLRATEILSGADMLNGDDFAKLLGTTRVTVNAKAGRYWDWMAPNVDSARRPLGRLSLSGAAAWGTRWVDGPRGSRAGTGGSGA
jgi:hypothetical protein